MVLHRSQRLVQVGLVAFSGDRWDDNDDAGFGWGLGWGLGKYCLPRKLSSMSRTSIRVAKRMSRPVGWSLSLAMCL